MSKTRPQWKNAGHLRVRIQPVRTKRVVRAVATIDTGSTLNWISFDLAQRLHLPVVGERCIEPWGRDTIVVRHVIAIVSTSTWRHPVVLLVPVGRLPSRIDPQRRIRPQLLPPPPVDFVLGMHGLGTVRDGRLCWK